MTIDAKRISQPEHFRQFINACTSNIMISVAGQAAICTSIDNEFLDSLLDLELHDDEEIRCSSGTGDEKVEFILTGYDINWWKQSSRRSNKLYRAISGETETQKEVKSEKKYSVAAATLQEGRLSQIKTFEGDKKAVTNFFNEEITTRYLDDFLKMRVVLDLAYEEGDENDVSQWLTLDELQEMGAIKLYE